MQLIIIASTNTLKSPDYYQLTLLSATATTSLRLFVLQAGTSTTAGDSRTFIANPDTRFVATQVVHALVNVIVDDGTSL